MSEQVLVKTFETSSDVAKHRFVKFDTNGKITESTNGGKVLGANCGPVAPSGERIDVGIIGIFEVEASGIISAGATVASSSGGKAKLYASGEKAGIALSASSANGDLIRVLIQQ